MVFIARAAAPTFSALAGATKIIRKRIKTLLKKYPNMDSHKIKMIIRGKNLH
jgi:hypothetical protein